MEPPSPQDLQALKPLNGYAWIYVVVNILLISGGLTIAAGDYHLSVYMTGQVLLALGFTQALVVLHEAGHRTLFRQRWLNDLVGYFTGFLALIPYASWRPIHARHHKYTGWQDLDVTTASLVPRRLARWERFVINGAWLLWLPLFSVLYRLQSYWRIKRITPFLPATTRPGRLWFNAVLQFLAYAVLTGWWGLSETLVLLGPGLLLALMGQDLLLLSQHTDMPTNLGQGRDVRPFPPLEQGPFTRSLRLPAWLSWLLLHFDAHELHHLYPAVPGYLLRDISYVPPNEEPWLSWVWKVKHMSGTRFLFGETGTLEGGE